MRVYIAFGLRTLALPTTAHEGVVDTNLLERIARKFAAAAIVAVVAGPAASAASTAAAELSSMSC